MILKTPKDVARQGGKTHQPASTALKPWVLSGMNHLVTLTPLAQMGDFSQITTDSLGILSNRPWIAVDTQGHVAAHGEGDIPPPYSQWEKQAVLGGTLLPGLVESHSHPIWAGHRAQEFVLKSQGKTYQDIARMGGGIMTTVRATREASDESLLSNLVDRLASFASHGVTTMEIKSGYGLSIEHELRLLKLLDQAKRKSPYTLHITCLALHAHSPDGLSPHDYIKRCSEELLPEAHRLGIVQSVDAFVEDGYFTAQETVPYLKAARDLGLGIRLHADEFTDAGATALGLDWKAQSLDHLQCINAHQLTRFKQSPGTVATLLPATSLYSRLPWAQARMLRQHGIPVALGTDYNPGSCLIKNLPMVASLATVHCGLTVEEAVAAITLIPAFSLGLTPKPKRDAGPCSKEGWKGALASGFDADMVLFPQNDLAQWIADFGQSMPKSLWIRGQRHIPLHHHQSV